MDRLLPGCYPSVPAVARWRRSALSFCRSAALRVSDGDKPQMYGNQSHCPLAPTYRLSTRPNR